MPIFQAKSIPVPFQFRELSRMDRKLYVFSNLFPVVTSEVQLAAEAVAEAKAAEERKDLKRAEELFVSANKPEMALAMYQEAGLWDEAVEVATLHLPHKLSEVKGSH